MYNPIKPTHKHEKEIKAIMRGKKLSAPFVQSELWWARSKDARELYDAVMVDECAHCYRDLLAEYAHRATRISEILSRLYMDWADGKFAREALIKSLEFEYDFCVDVHKLHTGNHEPSCEKANKTWPSACS